MPPAVFLDRDDTININADLPPEAWDRCRPGDLLNPAFVRLLPGSRDACRQLAHAGYRLIVITNQAGVAHRGGRLRDIDATNARLDELLTVDGRRLITCFYSAPTHPDGDDPRFAIEHPWRKPGPGMVRAAAAEHALDLSRSWMVGDKQRDLDAATAAGVPIERALRIAPGARFADLPDAARFILEHTPRPGAAAATTTTVTLRADDPNLLGELADTVVATARGIAERHGARLVDLGVRGGRLEATIVAGRLAAMGYMSEVRRATNAWARSHRGRPIWPVPDDHG
jgi:D-glycero-D-manno-heptose 1,7-bisphosphate phosphatase